MTPEDISSVITNCLSFHFVPEECPATSRYEFLYSYFLMAMGRPFDLTLLTHR